MYKFIKKHYPLFLSLTGFWIFVLILFFLLLNRTQGTFVYLLDDPYIHLSIAKNLVLNGNFGVNPGIFQSATSSPVWTLLISFFFWITGIYPEIPFIINLFLSSALIIFLYLIFRKENYKPGTILFMLSLIILAAPLPALVFTGLEHVLHTVVTVLVIYHSWKYFSFDDARNLKYVYILLPILAGVRYEGMFLILSISLFLLLRKEWFKSFMIILLGFLPVLIYGIISLNNGWWFFPNSILLKSNISAHHGLFPIINSVFYNGYRQLAESPAVFLLIIISLIIFLYNTIKEKVFLPKSNYLQFIFILFTALHLQFAGVGWFYRYEAYIIVSGILINILSIHEIFSESIKNFINGLTKQRKLLLYLFILLILSPLIHRGVESLYRIPVAAGNIYEQQFQMAKFINLYYPNKTIAVNDIGLINFYCKIKTVDLWGITNRDAAEAKLEGNYNKGTISRILKNNDAEIAILYSSWFDGLLPEQWQTAGSWEIMDNIVCGDDEVIFVSDTNNFYKLKKYLSEFSVQLPKRVFKN